MPRRRVVVELTRIGHLVDARAIFGIHMHDRDSPGQFCSIRYPGKALENARMTRGGYRAMLVNQDGVCAICGRGHILGPLFIDHDHACCNKKWTCGKCVRGLLCGDCNTWLIDVELDRNHHKHSEQWWKDAVAYLCDRGCDPADPERLATHIEIHRQGRVGARIPCSCRYCANGRGPL
jgi:hypothetical protein